MNKAVLRCGIGPVLILLYVVQHNGLIRFQVPR